VAYTKSYLAVVSHSVSPALSGGGSVVAGGVGDCNTVETVEIEQIPGFEYDKNTGILKLDVTQLIITGDVCMKKKVVINASLDVVGAITAPADVNVAPVSPCS